MKCTLLFGLIVAVTAIGCHDPDKYLPTSPDNPDGALTSPILELTSDVPSIRATGAAHAVITARIDPRSTVKTMTFATSRGTLAGNGQKTSAEKTSIDVPVSDSGVVSVDLQSGTIPGLATVTATIKTNATPPVTFTRTVDVVFSAVNSADVITLTATPSTADADGASLVTLTARFSPEVALVNQNVVFTASAGEFATHKDSTSANQATVPVNGDVATVELRSPQQAGTVTATARVGTFSAVTTITFNRAGPDTVFVQPARSTVARVGATVVITTYLTRSSGQVASNTVVTYEARDSSGAVIGTFLAPTIAIPDDQDTSPGFKRLKSTAVFDPDDTAALGAATITVQAAGRSASTVIQIQ